MEAIQDLLNPSLLPSLKNGLEIKVYIVLDPLRLPRTPTIIKSLLPFSTIEDLKREIWLNVGAELDYLPKFQFLGVLRENPHEEDFPQTDQQYYSADAYWYESGANTDTPISLETPLDILRSSQPDERFVDTDGRLQALQVIKRDRVTIEDAFIKTDGDVPVFHCFFLSGLIAYGNLTSPISEYDFNGRITPYFPAFSVESQLTPTTNDMAFATALEKYARSRRSINNKVNTFIEENPEKINNLRLKGVSYLRFAWKEKIEGFQGPQGLFYNLAANERRPFIRYLPVDGVPLTKLYSPGGLTLVETISLENVKLWAQEKSPVNDHDYVFMKILLHQGLSSLFGTLRMHEEGTADFIIQPPKGVRNLDISSDLGNLEEFLIEGIAKTSLNPEKTKLDVASLILYISLEPSTPKITKTDIRTRLRAMQPFFQEITPLPNEQPLIMLRYKGVSNYANEDSIAAFLTQIVAKSIQNGVETNRITLRAQVAENFGLEEEVAKNRVDAWFTSRSQFGIADAEKNDIKQLSNTGIDIAIFTEHPYYFIHIYRAQGNEDLKRIYTLISLLLSASKKDIKDMYAEPVSDEVEAAVEPRVDVDGFVVSPEQPVAENSAEDVLPTTIDAVQTQEGDGDLEDLGGFLTYAIGEEETTGPENVVNPYEQTQNTVETSPLPPPEPRNEIPNDTGVPVRQPQVPAEEGEGEGEEENEKEDEGPVKVASLFLDRLKKLDKQLFAYKKTDKADKSVKHYSTGCQANYDRQPLIITELEYKILKERYEPELEAVPKKLFIKEYPISGTQNPETPPRGAEILHVLKYGSDPSHQNYFLCPQYFCIRDNIMVLEKDFISNRDRQGKPKPAQSCPFCHGTPIKDKNHPAKNETIYIRKNKPKYDKAHLFIRMLDKQRNPDGLALPCCFTDPKELRKADPYFAHIREYEEKHTSKSATTPGGPVVKDKPVQISQQQQQLLVDLNYQILKNHLNSEYIVGPEKYPLEPGKVGICSPVLDTYLGQVSSSFVERTAIRQVLTQNASGFLRIGVVNSIQRRNISILAALAPFLTVVDTPEGVAGFIYRSIFPPIFQSLNYGNLLLEFYDPSYPPPETDNELSVWAKNWFDVQDLSRNRDYFLRLWKSYNNFVSILKDVERGNRTSFQFELRHFAHMLAEPGILTSRGITTVVLDYSGNPNDPKTTINVRCPLQGFNNYTHSNNDIGFLTHSSQGIWEPLIYTENTPPTGEIDAIHDGTYLFQMKKFNELGSTEQTNVIRKRITEFSEKCNSIGLAAFSPTTGVDPQSLIPKFKLINSIPYPVEGIVCDSYNHIVGATFVLSKSKKKYQVYVPFADDGTLSHLTRKYLDPSDKSDKKFEVKKIHFGFDDIISAPTDGIVNFYKRLEVPFSLYKGYTIKQIVLFSNNRIAVELANGILVPASSVSRPSEYPDIPIINSQGKDPEWYINQTIAGPKQDDVSNFAEDKTLFLKRKEAEEVFNHLRLTFANYVAGPIISNGGADLRQTIRDIISRIDLDMYERRKRLEILLGPLILSWLTPTDKFSPSTTLLRMDCHITDKEQCDNYCIWKDDANTCSIHSPETITLGGRQNEQVDAPRFFMIRLLDELLRIPMKRRQLLNRDVPYLSAPKTQVKIGNQTFIPEHNTQWYQQLIEDAMKKPLERPKYYEEFAGTRESQPSQFLDRIVLPETLKPTIGVAESEEFRLWPAHDYYSLFVALDIDLSILTGREDIAELDSNILTLVRKKFRKTIIHIDLTHPGGSPIVTGSSKETPNIVIIVTLETGQPSILVDKETPNIPIIFKNKLGDRLQKFINNLPEPRVRRPKTPN